MNKLIVILIFIILNPIYGNGPGNSVNINGDDKDIIFQTINSIEYIDINDLSKLLDVKTNTVAGQIILEKESLKFASGSFFVVYDNIIKLRVAQMSLPCIKKEGSLQIPWLTFLNSMKKIGLMNFSYVNNKYYIKTDIFLKKSKFNNEKLVIDKPIILLKDTIINHNSKSDIYDSNSTKITMNPKPISEITDSIKNPTKYIIPKGLVK